ncbi:protoheme IX farnesyltransferase [Sneathiella sp. P13V-1]|uniref:heme o synthase n=1 Tax=Sneathiella sp. P13V-1 TaxID=2697366 RepID=UPI00187B8DF5|nr:heme o synthase [Sneathiella sp. P13V-1]MBE7635598.1 protoheme IX farnesyltransferase [Sneathiella sp. P13V-1]
MSDTSIASENTARADYGSARASDYFALLKPRVMSLVVFTGLVGMAVAPGDLHPVLAFTALLCIAVGAGASGAINMWYDADIDQIMERTKNRPVPSGKVTAGEALAVGVSLSVASVILMGLAVNLVAATLLAITIGFYIFIYTMWLKRRTPQNIVIGGAAGAFPPMIGWAAVTGNVSVESLVLFAIIFFWTPPHFWALSLWRDIDYANAGVPMLPVVAGREATRRQVVIYSVLLFPIAVMPYFLGYAGIVYGLGSAVLGGVFLFGAVKVWLKKDEKSAKQLFAFSLLYLFLIFALLLGEAIVKGLV